MALTTREKRNKGRLKRQLVARVVSRMEDTEDLRQIHAGQMIYSTTHNKIPKPVTGQFRYNVNTQYLELYDGKKWVQLNESNTQVTRPTYRRRK